MTLTAIKENPDFAEGRKNRHLRRCAVLRFTNSLFAYCKLLTLLIDDPDSRVKGQVPAAR
jgi:hypothetical protein